MGGRPREHRSYFPQSHGGHRRRSRGEKRQDRDVCSCLLCKDELGDKTGLAEWCGFGATPKGQTHTLSRTGRCRPGRRGGRSCVLKAPGTSQHTCNGLAGTSPRAHCPTAAPESLSPERRKDALRPQTTAQGPHVVRLPAGRCLRGRPHRQVWSEEGLTCYESGKSLPCFRRECPSCVGGPVTRGAP